MKEGFSPAFSSSSHTQPGARAPNGSQPHLEEAARLPRKRGGCLYSQQERSPLPWGGPPAPSRGDKMPEMAALPWCPRWPTSCNSCDGGPALAPKVAALP